MRFSQECSKVCQVFFFLDKSKALVALPVMCSNHICRVTTHKPFDSVVPNVVSARLLSGYLDLSIYLVKAVFWLSF